MTKSFTLPLCESFLLFLLVGCATPHDTGPAHLTPTAARGVKTIAIVQPANPPQIVILDDSAFSRGAESGVLGILPLGMMAAGSQRSSTKASAEFAKNMEGLSFNINQILSNAVFNGLKRAGYEVRLVEGLKANANTFAASYRSLEPKGDAYLDMVVKFVGFHDRAGEKGYGPEVSVHARLIAGKDSSILHDGVVTARLSLAGEEFKTDPRYLFKDHTEIINDRERALAGLRLCIEKAADMVCTDLQPDYPVVHFHHTLGFLIKWLPMKVFVDDREIELRAFAATKIKPKRHQIIASLWDGSYRSKPVEFDAIIGKEYCVKVHQGYGTEIELLTSEKSAKMHPAGRHINVNK